MADNLFDYEQQTNEVDCSPIKVEVTNYGELSNEVKVNVLTGLEVVGNLPGGGLEGYILVKNSDTEYDAGWTNEIPIKLKIAALEVLATPTQDNDIVRLKELNALKDLILGNGSIDVAFDTIKEISEWIKQDQTGTAALITRVNENEVNISLNTQAIEQANLKINDNTSNISLNTQAIASSNLRIANNVVNIEKNTTDISSLQQTTVNAINALSDLKSVVDSALVYATDADIDALFV